WHLYVTQGVLFGIGASLAYYPAIAVPSQYFVKNRGLAIGIAVSGTGLGGFALAPLTNALIDKVGIFWTLRILGLMIFVVCGGASFLIAERKEHLEEQQRPSFLQSLHVFRDPRFLSLTIAELAASIGYLIPLYYMQTYAVYIGLSAQQGALILGLSNGSGFVGRILLGLIADRLSNTKTLLFCCWATAFSVMVFWMVAKSFGTLLLMGMTFCLFSGAYVSLVPVAVAESFGTDTIASMIGLMYGTGGVAIWGGSPLAGYILDSTLPNLSYTPVIMTAGGSLVLGAICVTSWAYFHWRATRSVASIHNAKDALLDEQS
ncbi:major facilitator superfamily domain-containing protein, partial [Dissophora ornata]